MEVARGGWKNKRGRPDTRANKKGAGDAGALRLSGRAYGNLKFTPKRIIWMLLANFTSLREKLTVT